MPTTDVRSYMDSAQENELLEWFSALKKVRVKGVPRAFERAQARIVELSERGNQLRRPAAGYLRDGIHELRWRVVKVQYRILYGFTGQGDHPEAVLLMGLTKEGEIEEKFIEKAMSRLDKFKTNRRRHDSTELLMKLFSED